MRIVCAWCEKEGKSALICEVEPFEDPMETHGICVAHRASFLAELARSLTPAHSDASFRAPAEPTRTEPAAPAPETRRLAEWLGEGQELVRVVVPRLAEQIAALERRCAAAEQAHAELQRRVDDARREAAILEEANRRWQELEGEILALLDPLIDRVLTDTIRPMYRLSRTLRARRPRAPKSS